MSFISVSESDSDNSSSTRRHPYNTRSNKSSNARQVFNAKKVNKGKQAAACSPTFQYTRQTQDDDSMDYCFDSCPTPPRKKKNNAFCSFLKGTLYTLLFTGALFVVYSQYVIHHEVNTLKDEMKKIRGGKTKEDPHAKLSKELDKKCSETLKLLLKDPVGRPDFALQSSGGQVVHVEAIPYSNPKTFFGFSLCEGAHGPNSMIQATTSPGECWAFKGQNAKAIIQLIDFILVDAVTLEHIPLTISPSGTIDTAVKDFKIWGLEQLHGNKRLLGQFRYEADGGTVQTFNINNDSSYYKYVELEVLSNHGNKDFTCVYRIRVHGNARKFD